MHIFTIPLSAALGLLMVTTAEAQASAKQSHWAAAPSETAVRATERLRSQLSTRSPLQGCARRSRNCALKPCCNNRPCRQASDGEPLCR